MQVVEKRKLNEAEDAVFEAKPEIYGSYGDFIPWNDRVLIRRLPVVQTGMIARPDAYTELSERGVVINIGSAVDPELEPKMGEIVATFSRYGAEEKLFDDQGDDHYCLVRQADIRGYHAR